MKQLIGVDKSMCEGTGERKIKGRGRVGGHIHTYMYIPYTHM